MFYSTRALGPPLRSGGAPCRATTTTRPPAPAANVWWALAVYKHVTPSGVRLLEIQNRVFGPFDSRVSCEENKNLAVCYTEKSKQKYDHPHT